MLSALPLLLALSTPTQPVAFQEPAGAAAPQELVLANLGLTLNLPELADFEEGRMGGEQIQGSWTGMLGEHELEIRVWGLPVADFGFGEPEEVTTLIRENLERRGDNEYVFQSRTLMDGNYGYAPYGALETADRREGTDDVAELFVFGGLLREYGYSIEIEVTPEPKDEVRETILEFFKNGVIYDGDVRNAEWTEDEIEERWRAEFPEDLLDERIRVIRTDHYIIVGDSSGAKAFAKQMEKNYDTIQEQFGFEEVEGRRLMPVFLFRNRDDYVSYMVKATGGSMTREAAARSAGFAYKDFYATTYDSPKDTVHVHESTHQIFRNRLQLGGGGSWFQESTAEFMESVVDNSAKARIENYGKNASKKGEFTPFREFFQLSSLLYSNQDQEAAGDAYTQAATIMWFVLRSKATRDKAEDYLYGIGSQGRGDIDAIERELRRVFGVDVEGFEQLYLEYWKRPKG